MRKRGRPKGITLTVIGLRFMIMCQTESPRTFFYRSMIKKPETMVHFLANYLPTLERGFLKLMFVIIPHIVLCQKFILNNFKTL